jgi:hypothetical protein
MSEGRLDTVERCELCGFVWADVAAAEVPGRVVEGAGAIAARLRTSPGVVGRRPTPERWSMLEYGAHVRDVLYHVRDRFVIGLAEDNPGFKPLYRDLRVDLGLYAGDDPGVTALEVELAAGLFARTFARLSPEQLARPCRYAFPVESERTLRWMGQHVVHEVEHHRGDVEEDARLLGA